MAIGRAFFVALGLVLVCCAPSGDSSKLPSFIKPCPRDGDIRKCILEEGRRILRRFTEGIEELDIPPLDPLYVGDLEEKGPGGIFYKQKGLVVKGFRNAKILDLRFDLEKKTGHAHIFGNLTTKCNYTVDGQLLLFPIKGNGESITKIKDYDMKTDWTWEFFIGKDGLNYTRQVDYKSTVDYGKVQFKMTGLFDNDKTLSDTFNKILSANSKEIMKDLGGPTIKFVERKVNDIFNDFFSRIPYEDLLA